MQTVQIDLIAPYPIQECVERLQHFAQNHTSFSLKTRLELKRMRNGNYHFRILRSHYSLPIHRRAGLNRGFSRSNYVKLQVSGYLTRWPDSGSTIVIGEAQILPKTFVVNGGVLLGFALVVLFLTTAFLSDFLFLAPIVIFIIFSFAHTALIQPEQMALEYQRVLLRQLARALQY